MSCLQALECNSERGIEAWMVEEIARKSISDDAAAVEHEHAFKKTKDQVEVVHHHHRKPVFSATNQGLHDIQTMPDVEAAAGSSASSTGGSITSTIASSTRARSPPDRLDHRRSHNVASSNFTMAAATEPSPSCSARAAPS